MATDDPNSVYEDFDPPSDLVSEQGCDTILIYLPGFRKDQLKVQLTTSRILKVSGERPIGNNRWRRFYKEFGVSTNCDIKEITAKFEGGILYIRKPKLINPTPPPTVAPTPATAATTTELQPPKVDHTPPVEVPKPPQSPPRPQQPPQPQPPLPLIPEESKSEDGNKDSGESSANREPRVVAGIGLFKELKKPETVRRFIVSVLMVVIIGFYISHLFKSLTKREHKQIVIEHMLEL